MGYLFSLQTEIQAGEDTSTEIIMMCLPKVYQEGCSGEAVTDTDSLGCQGIWYSGY